MKNILLVFVLLPVMVHSMNSDLSPDSSLPGSTDFFSNFSVADHLVTGQGAFGQRVYGLNLSDCQITSLTGLGSVPKRCGHFISAIDLSNNSIKKIKLSKFLKIFPFLQELKLNGCGLTDAVIDELPKKFNLEMMNNDLRDIDTFIAHNDSACNVEGNWGLTLQSKKNIEQAFKRPLLNRFVKLSQSIHIYDDIRDIRFFFAAGVALIYLTRGMDEYVSKVIIARGIFYFICLSAVTCLMVKNYYSDYHQITYKGRFKF